jgi:hypothetical protein
LTTNGDLLYGTGSGALARKAIGSTGQVLTVAAGIPSWATPSSGTTFVGASVSMSGYQSVADLTETILLWDTEQYDTDSIHNTSSTHFKELPQPNNEYLGFEETSTSAEAMPFLSDFSKFMK